MITDNKAVDLLIDEFGEYETMVFCEIYSRYCNILLDSGINHEEIELDKSHDSKYFKNKHDELKGRITGKVTKI